MRGMKKWLPFKSLNGQYEMLDTMKENKKKVDRPELSLDQIDELNHCLITMKKGDKAKVTYYDSGMVVTKQLIYIKCDGYEQKALFKGFSLKFMDLIRIEL
jgi:hypothetical protein